MAFVTTTSPDLYSTTSNLEEIPAGADPLQYADDEKMNQILVGLTALHGWASGVPVSETANGHFLALAAGSSAAVSIAGGVRIRQSSGALDYSYNTGAYARLLSKLTLASQAAGDIMYASDANTWVRLGVGTNGHVLTLSGGLPVWAAAGGGGGGIADSDNVTWTGTHSFEGASFNVNPLATFAAGLNLTGTLAITGGATISTTLGLAAGAVGAPSLYQTGDTNTGIYFPAADQFAITTAGTARLVIDGSTELHSLIQTGPAGSASLPTYGFTGDPNTGAYNIGADQYGITAGGTLRASFNTTQQTLYTDALIQETNAATETAVDVLTLSLLSSGTPAADLGARILVRVADDGGAASDAGALLWSWEDPTATSEDSEFTLYNTAAGTLSGVLQVRSTGQVVFNAGSASVPTMSINSDPNTGWYSEGADQLNASLGGTQRHKIGTTYARYALNGGVYKDSSAFEVIVGGAGADGRGRFENNISSTGVSGIISTNDNSWSGTMLVDGSGTTRTGVAGNTYFVGLTSQAHFGALTNTDSHWITGTADSTADRVASAVYNAGNRYLRVGYFMELSEMSAPSAGAANTARIFAVDSGGGKTVLKVIFASGAAQTIATEP